MQERESLHGLRLAVYRIPITVFVEFYLRAVVEHYFIGLKDGALLLCVRYCLSWELLLDECLSGGEEIKFATNQETYSRFVAKMII